MFNVGEDGTLLYVPDPDAVPSPSPDGGSLFDVPEDAPQAPEEGVLEGQAADPQAPEDAAADGVPEGLTGSGNSVSLPTGSGNAVYVPVASPDGDFSVTTSGDVYIYPEVPEEALAEARSSSAATVLGLPNATSLQYLEDVAVGYPSWYKYMAFKTDANYSQSMVLYIAPQGGRAASQQRIDFTDVDCIEVRYVRSGTTNYYQYAKTHYDSYQVAYDSDVFLYTNVVDGYARLDLQQPFPVSRILFLALAVSVILLILRGGGKH